jgi:hypothetical protein
MAEHTPAPLPINASEFYAEYHGHPLSHLQAVVSGLRKHSNGIVWLAGDSTLDNKHWFFSGGEKRDPKHLLDDSFAADAIHGYENLLSPPRMVCDVAYWLNKKLADSGTGLCCVNTAIEESTLLQRRSELMEQDELLSQNLQSNDVIVLSIGGNDVALRPTPDTRRYIVPLLTAPEGSDEFNTALLHFIGIFKQQTEAFISKLLAGREVRAVVVCMLYYLDETKGSGWCEAVLEQMGYNKMPQKLQSMIDAMYKMATTQVTVPGVTVVPVALSSVLDGKTTADYCQRVEPSFSGGEKMASAILNGIESALPSDSSRQAFATS